MRPHAGALRLSRASFFSAILFGTVSAVWTSAIAANESPAAGKAADAVKTIGVVAPLTGTAQSWGSTVQKSVLLASRRFDPSGRVKFLFEDDQLQPKNTVTAVNKLLREQKVDGLIIYGSPTALAVNSIAEQAAIPMVALSIVDRVVEGKKFVMKHWVPARTENDIVSAEVARRGYKRIAMVTAQNDAMLALKSLFRETNSARIVLDEEFPRENTDFRATITKLRGLQADAVYVLLWSPQPGTFARQLREQGFTGDVFGVHNLEDGNEVSAAGGALKGAWLVTGDDRRAGSYLTAYLTEYRESPTAGGVNGYDVAKMFIDGADSADLNGFLHSLKNFEGGFGVYSATSRNDFEIPAIIKEVTDQGFRATPAH